MDNILKQTDDTLKAGDHSLYKIDKHIKPFEYICSWVGICPTNMTSGLSIGYILNYKKRLTYSLLNLNWSVKFSLAYKVFSAPLKDIYQILGLLSSTFTEKFGNDLRSANSLFNLLSL